MKLSLPIAAVELWMTSRMKSTSKRSISKRDMYAGRADKWRLEATLLRLESGMLELDLENIDAAHPGGGVIDEGRGVQHIFVYCGKYVTPSGIYRITRVLDTMKLRKAVGAIR